MKKNTMEKAIELLNGVTGAEEVVAEIRAELDKAASANQARQDARSAFVTRVWAKIEEVMPVDKPMTAMEVYEAVTDWGDLADEITARRVQRILSDYPNVEVDNTGKKNTYMRKA